MHSLADPIHTSNKTPSCTTVKARVYAPGRIEQQPRFPGRIQGHGRYFGTGAYTWNRDSSTYWVSVPVHVLVLPAYLGVYMGMGVILKQKC